MSLRKINLSENIINETTLSKTFKTETAGYILDDGSFAFVDEYHGEDSEYRDEGYPEFSNTHPEDDTCVRIYKEPNKAQYEQLEKIIDLYLDREGYCKVELLNNPLGSSYFYECYSIFEGACSDITLRNPDKIGNWTGYDLVKVIKHNIDKNAYDKSISESLINEATRNQLIAKSKKGQSYKDPSKGNRWTAKKKCSIYNSVRDYNSIDMNKLWKNDTLIFGVKVHGETDNYVVTVEFSNILNRVKSNIINNHNEISIKCIYNALFQALNSSDVKIGCSCPDFKYRFQVWATKNDYNAISPEEREAKITNPKDSLGAACKHVLAVLNNAEWLNKIASVINNYIWYCKDNMEYNYGKFIFPKLYGVSYEKAAQLSIDNFDEKGELSDILKTDEDIINLSNALGKIRGRIKKGSNKNPISNKNK